eukprot:jgi/Ulvmu1/2098/UM125_0001.1
MVNAGKVWIDNVYLKLSRHLVRPNFMFITAGALNGEVWPLIGRSDIYITQTTFQGEHRGNAHGLVADTTGCSIYFNDCIFTDWAGSTSIITLKFQSICNVRNTVFRNMHLQVEIADVSFAGIVRFENVSLANVTLEHGAVVSTTLNDYGPAVGSYLTYYAEDDEDFDVEIQPVPPSERGVFGEEFVIVEQTMSDCVYLLAAAGTVFPGCPQSSLMARNDMISRSSVRGENRTRTGMPFENLPPAGGVGAVRPETAGQGGDDSFVPLPPGEYLYDREVSSDSYGGDYIVDGAGEPLEYDTYSGDDDAEAVEDYRAMNNPQLRYEELLIRADDEWLAATQQVLPTRPPAPEGWPPLVPDNSSTSTSSPEYVAAVVLVPPLTLVGIPEAESTPPLATPNDTFPIGASAFMAIAGVLCLAILVYLVVAWRCGRGAKRGSSTHVELAAGTWHASEAGGVVGGGTLPLGPSGHEQQMKQKQVAQLMRQLDEFRKGSLLLGRFEVLGHAHCAIGGETVVQYALNPTDGKAYAIKFFLDQNMFRAEATLHAAFRPSLREHLSSHLASAAAAAARAAPDQAPAPEEFLPKVLKMWDNADGRLHDMRGTRLPPLLVMHRQVSLQDWADDNAPDVFSVLAMLSSVSKRLSALHDAGYVHCNLKPSKILLPASTRLWKVSGFSRVVRAGSEVPLRFTLAYAAPEVVAACMSGCEAIRCTPALDAWALGVVAFEMLTGTSAFNLVTDGSAKAVAQLRGEQLLPWEGPRCGPLLHRLGVLRPAVLHLIERDPAQRSTARQFHTACSDAFSQHMEVDPAI